MRKLFAKAQDPISCETHALGAVAALGGGLLYLLRGVWTDAAIPAVAAALCFCLSMAALYAASAIYHYYPGTAASGGVKRVLRKMDHSMIYVLIAGSYTPICLTALRSSGGPSLLAVVWTVGLAGIILTLAKLSIPRWLTSAIYLFMGWLAIFAIVPLHRSLPEVGFAWLLAGGLLYTVGGVLYAAKWPGRNNPRFGCHEIFHVFILLGSLCHFFLMYQVIAHL